MVYAIKEQKLRAYEPCMFMNSTYTNAIKSMYIQKSSLKHTVYIAVNIKLTFRFQFYDRRMMRKPEQLKVVQAKR